MVDYIYGAPTGGRFGKVELGGAVVVKPLFPQSKVLSPASDFDENKLAYQRNLWLNLAKSLPVEFEARREMEAFASDLPIQREPKKILDEIINGVAVREKARFCSTFLGCGKDIRLVDWFAESAAERIRIKRFSLAEDLESVAYKLVSLKLNPERQSQDFWKSAYDMQEAVRRRFMIDSLPPSFRNHPVLV